MASIVKREGPRGPAYLVRYRDPSGQTRNRTFKRKRDADKFANTIEADLVRGEWIDPAAGQITLATYSRQWLARRGDLRPRTAELYDSLLRRHLLPDLGDLQLARITTARVRSWRDKKLGAGQVGPVTVAKAYRLLRAVLNTAVEDGLLSRNPCVLKGAGVERSPERPVATPSQVWALAEAIEPRFRAVVLVAAFCGLRFGEIAGLARRHVNVFRRELIIERQLVELGAGVEFGPPKTDAGVRTIAMPPQLVTEMEKHLSRFACTGADDLMFTGAKGAPLTRGNWHPKWDQARAAVTDLPEGFRFHDLRHTSITIAAASGASTKELMARMGHASPDAALRYQHATRDRDAQIADAIGQALSKGQ